jgi:hypothetical protein
MSKRNVAVGITSQERNGVVKAYYQRLQRTEALHTLPHFGYTHTANPATLRTGMLIVSTRPVVSKNRPILLANSNQWYFNKLVKIPCHKTPYRCPHRLNLSSQSSRSCAGPNIKMLKDKDLEFANSIRGFSETGS